MYPRPQLLPGAERATFHPAPGTLTFCLPLFQPLTPQFQDYFVFWSSFLGLRNTWTPGSLLRFGRDLEKGVVGTKARCCWATGTWSNGDGMGVQPSPEFPSAEKYAADKDALFWGSQTPGKGSFTAPWPLPGKSWGWLPCGMHLILTTNRESRGRAGSSGPAPGEVLGPCE